MPISNLLDLDEQSIRRITDTCVPICKAHNIYLNKYSFQEHIQEYLPILLGEVKDVFYKA